MVNKTVSLIGNGSESTTIDAQFNGTVVTINASLVTLSGFTVMNSGGIHYGIQLLSDHNTITQVNSTGGNYYGIHLYQSRNNLISDSKCSNNWNAGISLFESHSNSITDNDCTKNGRSGIYLEYSNDCILKNNDCSDFNRPKSIGWTYGVRVIQSNNITISNNVCSNNNYGINIRESYHTVILNNSCVNNSYHNIELQNCIQNEIMFNTCVSESFVTKANSSINGIEIRDSTNNLIRGNHCSGHADGIRLAGSENNIIEFNFLIGNLIGIYIDNSLNCLIVNNSIIDNLNGIAFSYNSMNSTVLWNNIIGNEIGVNCIFNGRTIVNATHNYWGDDSGPYHRLNNSKGQGVNITDNVLFEPWLDEHGNLVYLPEIPDDGDKPDKIPLYILFGLLVALISVLVITVRTPGLSSPRKASQVQASTTSWDSSDVVNINGKMITCEYCHQGFDVAKNEKALRVPCPYCGKNSRH